MRKTVLSIVLMAVLVAAAYGTGEAEGSQEESERVVSIYRALNASIASVIPTFSDSPLWQEYEERVDIDVEWVHPPVGQEGEAFNLMIASGDLPDMIYLSGWFSYPGGPNKAITDGVIISLNDVIAEDAPNLKALYEEHPDWELNAKTDDGTHFMFPFVRESEELMVYWGPQARQDWLDQVGLDVPVTLEDWEEMILAFREAGLSESPLSFSGFRVSWLAGFNHLGSVLVQPFGVTWDFFVEEGEVKFGPYEDAFADHLAFMKDWWDKGYIEPEALTNDRAAYDAKVLNGDIGVWFGYTGGGIGKYLDATEDPEFDIVGLPYPVQNEGETPFFGQYDHPINGYGLAITPQADDVTLAAEFADYSYSEEGHLLNNFGVEGLTYEWRTDYPAANGERWPIYTDYMTNNPDGLTFAQMGYMHTQAFGGGHIVQDRRYIYQYAGRPQQQAAIATWSRTEAAQHRMPRVTPTPEEAQELASIMAEVHTYREEMYVRFLTGQEPLSAFEDFHAQLEQLGIERAIEIYQAALDRFNAR